MLAGGSHLYSALAGTPYLQQLRGAERTATAQVTIGRVTTTRSPEGSCRATRWTISPATQTERPSIRKPPVSAVLNV